MSLGYETYYDRFRIGTSRGTHWLDFYSAKGHHLKFTSSTFGQPEKSGRIIDPDIQAVFRKIPMEVAFAGPVESSDDPQKTRTDRVCIRFNIEDAHVYIAYGQVPGRGDSIDREFVNIEEAFKMLKPIADKYATLLKAELQTLRREKRVRRG